MPEGLLDSIKIYLHITWVDTNTNTNLTGMINRGMARLQTIAGVPLDFAVEDTPRALLFDYVRYANSQALEMWEKNFASELMDLHIDSQVQAAFEEEALAAVVKVELSLAQADYDVAKILVDRLIAGAIKIDLTTRLAIVKTAIDAVVLP